MPFEVSSDLQPAMFRFEGPQGEQSPSQVDWSRYFPHPPPPPPPSPTSKQTAQSGISSSGLIIVLLAAICVMLVTILLRLEISGRRTKNWMPVLERSPCRYSSCILRVQALTAHSGCVAMAATQVLSNESEDQRRARCCRTKPHPKHEDGELESIPVST